MQSFHHPERRPSRPALHETSTQSSSTSWDIAQSSTSWDTQTVVADDEDDDHSLSLSKNQSQQVALLQRLLPRDVTSKLEPFDAMPIGLDHFAEGLVSFYLLHYPAATYKFNQKLNPHPVYTNFAIAMNAPACFQVILARSALYKKSAGQYGTSLERAELDTAIVEHKTHAIHRIRQLSEVKDDAGPGSKDELVASIISLGTFEMRLGSTDSGDVHYSAVRRLLKSIGGPMNIGDLRLKRVMCFFESIYGTPRNSYIWERGDFSGILKRFNDYLREMWEMWRERDGEMEEINTRARVEENAEFPFPTPTSRVPLDTSVKTGHVSKRKPTGPHSPYFGLQPLPESVPQPPPRPAPTAQHPVSKVPDMSTTPRITTAADLRRPGASSALKRPVRPAIRPPAKERARNVERQKGKQRAMQVDPWDPTEANLQSHRREKIPQPRPTTKDMPPPTPSQPATPKPRLYWKLHPSSALHQRLTLWNELSPSLQEKNLIWDLACLFCISAIATSPSFTTLRSLSSYMSKLSKIVSDANLHVSENNSNMMWLIQTNDATEEHSRRMWEVAGFTWVCKHLNVRVRRALRGWVWAFLVGERCQRRIVLSAFDFSYDSELALST
jgi:hypothetical protein